MQNYQVQYTFSNLFDDRRSIVVIACALRARGTEFDFKPGQVNRYISISFGPG